MAGGTVALFDLSAAQWDKARAGIAQSLDRLVAKAKLSGEQRAAALGRIEVRATVEDAAKDASVVVEATPERMELKRDLFATLDRVAPEGALLGTNTSSLSITEMASVVRDPARRGGLTLFNPVSSLSLIHNVTRRQTYEA